MLSGIEETPFHEYPRFRKVYHQASIANHKMPEAQSTVRLICLRVKKKSGNFMIFFSSEFDRVAVWTVHYSIKSRSIPLSSFLNYLNANVLALLECFPVMTPLGNCCLSYEEL